MCSTSGRIQILGTKHGARMLLIHLLMNWMNSKQGISLSSYFFHKISAIVAFWYSLQYFLRIRTWKTTTQFRPRLHRTDYFTQRWIFNLVIPMIYATDYQQIKIDIAYTCLWNWRQARIGNLLFGYINLKPMYLKKKLRLCTPA